MLYQSLKSALVLMVLAAALPVHAHHQDPTLDPRLAGNAGISVGTGSLFEIGHGDEMQVLFSVSWTGIDRDTGNHHVYYRYFSVGTQMTLAIGADGLADGAPNTLAINVVPVSRVETSHSGTTQTWRALPIEVRRDLDSGMSASVSIQAIGYNIYHEFGRHEHGGHGASADDHQHAVTTFAQIGADLLGFRYARFSEQGDFIGGQLAALQGQIGANWRPDESVTIRISLGGRGNIAVGALRDDRELGLVYEADAFARIQALLGQGAVRWALGVEGGYHLLGAEHTGHSHSDSGAASDHGAHGHPYVMITLGGSF